MKKAIFFLSGLMLFCFKGTCQDFPQTNLSQDYGSDLGSTMNGSSLDVEPYTGTAIVNFTLFKYQSKALNLHHGIVLDYDAQGNKVDAVASDLGLNWSLNVGAKITREIHGLPDEHARGWRNTPVAPSTIGKYDTALLQSYLIDSVDQQFDVFYYEAGDAHGKFIIGKSGQVLLIPRSSIKIDVDQPVLQANQCYSYKFRITTDDGTKYVFNTFDCADFHYNTGTVSASTEWFVSKIIAPFNQDSITFSYEPLTHNYQGGYRSNYLSYRNYNLDTDPYAINDFCLVSTNTDYNIRTWRPSAINYPDGTTVHYDYDGFNRMDLYTAQALKRLRITKGTSSKGINFYYSYMVRDTIENNGLEVPYQTPTGTLKPERYYSLQLNHFNEFGLLGDTLPGTYFSYTKKNLPPRLCEWGVDFWGFYNGEKVPAQTTIKPYNWVTRSTRIPACYRGSNLDHPGGNRLADLEFCKAKSLERVSLPTGGAVEFIYELHTSENMVTPNIYNRQTFPSIGGLRLAQMIFKDGTGQNNDRKKTFEYVKDDGSTSSGITVNIPVQFFNYTEYYTPYVFNRPTLKSALSCGAPTGTSGGFALLGRTGAALNYLVTTKGMTVGYSRVIMYEGTKSNYLKKKILEFTTAEDYPIPSNLLNNALPFPFIPDLDFAWGLPKKVTTATQTSVLETVEHTYSIDINQYDQPEFTSIKTSLKRYPMDSASQGFVWAYAHPLTGRVYNTASTTRTFFTNNKSRTVTTTTEFDTTYNVVRSVTAPSATGSVKTKYFYPFDFTINSGAIGLLKASGMNKSVLRVEIWNQSKDLLVDVKVSNLSVENNCVRIKEGYSFTPATNLNSSSWGAFNPNQLLPNSLYLTKEFTNSAFDSKGNICEIGNRSMISSCLYSKSGQHLIASATNSGIADIAYTSFEGREFGNWSVNSLMAVTPEAITGDSSGTINTSTYLFKDNLDINKAYSVTLYCKGGTPIISKSSNGGTTVSSTPLEEIETHRGWTLYRGKVSGANYIRVSSSANLKVDEVRLCPENALMLTKTFKDFKGVTSECNAANRVTYTEYDQFGRTTLVRDMDGNILSSSQYSLQQPQY